MKFCGADVPISDCFIITKSVIFDGETTELFQAELREKRSISLFHNSTKLSLLKFNWIKDTTQEITNFQELLMGDRLYICAEESR